jgi:hypothetical protein
MNNDALIIGFIFEPKDEGIRYMKQNMNVVPFYWQHNGQHESAEKYPSRREPGLPLPVLHTAGGGDDELEDIPDDVSIV